MGSTVRRLCFVLALAAFAGAGSAGAAFQGGNGPLAFTSDRDGNYEIYAEQYDGTLANVSNHPADDQSPAWSPDGRRIAFASFRDGNQALYLVNADGTELRRLTEGAGVDDATPSWSPDNRQIIFASTRPYGETWRLWAVNDDGTDLHLMTLDFAVDPAWSPDGSQIAYSGIDPATGASAIYVMDQNGLNAHRITTGNRPETQPSWSPDGRWLVFSRLSEGWQETNAQELFVIRDDGTSEFQLTSGGFHNANGVWSPDGQYIAFQRHPGAASNERDLFLVNAGAGEPRPIQDGVGANGDPDWSIMAPPSPPPPPPPPPGPRISIGMPHDGSGVVLGSLQNAFYVCRDGDSPDPLPLCESIVSWDGGEVRVASGDPLPSAPIGPKRFTVTAQDAAGNTSTLTHWYYVVYDFYSLFAPFTQFPTMSEWRAGRELPVRFSLAGNHGIDVLAKTVSREVVCEAPEFGQWGDPTNGTLHYNATHDRYTYAWATERSWADSCRQLVIKLDDGTYQYAYLRFTK